MRATSAPMLFAPPRLPVLIPRSRVLVLGRSAECDLQIPSRRASREHAEVRYDGERVVVRDLGSTNGTFVNGEQLEGERVLQPGDRIEIGEIAVTYCREEDDAPSPLEEEATAVLDRSSVLSQLEAAFRGDLAEVAISEVLQMLATAEKTGALGIVTVAGTARIWFADGRVVHAEYGRREGLEAAFAICRLRQGRFLFAMNHPLREPTFDLSATGLLLEAHRQDDEAGR